MTLLAGVDLAWQAKNPTAVALGRLQSQTLTLVDIKAELFGAGQVGDFLLTKRPQGIAVDAPLRIENQTGQRPCEQELARDYASRYASCHPANLSLYPKAVSVQLAEVLTQQGYEHLGKPDKNKWQIECYPHPALIEIFNLLQRHRYKKGKVDERKRGQQELARMLKGLEGFSKLKLEIPSFLQKHLDPDWIVQLRGYALKQNEDRLDAIICLVIAAWYQLSQPLAIYGDLHSGYIVVPKN